MPPKIRRIAMPKTVKEVIEERNEEAIKPMSHKEILQILAEEFEIPPNRMKSVFEGLAALAIDQLTQDGVPSFTIPGVNVKLVVRERAARGERPGRNPATGETIMIPAQPAKQVVRAVVQKRFQDKLGLN